MSSPALLLDVDLVAQLRALVRTSRFKRLVMVLLANKATGDEELDRLKVRVGYGCAWVMGACGLGVRADAVTGSQ